MASSDNRNASGGNADAQRRARAEARARDEREKREWREEAERAARQRRQRTQQQLQDTPWRSKFADLPQTHEQLEQHQQVRQLRERQEQAQRQRAQQAQQVQNGSLYDQRREEALRARQLTEARRAQQEQARNARRHMTVQQRQAEQRRQESQMRQPVQGDARQQAARQRVQQQPARQTATQQEALRQQRMVRQQQANQRRQSPKDAASRYARDAYVTGAQRRADSRSIYDRRPTIERPSGAQGGKRISLPHIPKQALAAIVAIFVIVVGVAIINPFGAFDSAKTTSPTGMSVKAKAEPSLPTPIMSESSGITMHSAVAMEDLTEILIHNASYSYANEITTQLTEATNTEVMAAHGTGRVASEQPTGDAWMTGEFIRCFRSGNAGPTMSAIDCGGPVGATVYAPVTGTVVLVKEYLLYDEIDDYQIHIQPEGRPDLDVVLIHLMDVSVQAGDKVTAGVTPIAKIRDIFQYLDESLQLKNYTALDDNGNHTHIQVNDATHPEYHGLDDLKPAEPAADSATTPSAATPGA